MSELEDTAISEYSSLRPTEFHDLIRFELKREWDEELDDTVTLEIDLAPTDKRRNCFLRLRFTGVIKLEYTPGYWSFCYIDVRKIEEKWQETCYRAFETEQDTDFLLVCRKFKAQLVLPEDV